MKKKVLIGLSVLIATFLIAIFCISFIYEEQVKKAIVNQINKQLIVPVKVGKINFTLLSAFPDASLEFNNVEASSVYANKQPADGCPKNLMVAKKISLQFNLWNLFNKNYTIKNIVLDGITVNIFIDENGNDNYHCWRVDSTANNTTVHFKLNQIKVTNSDVNYTNLISKTVCNFVINQSNSKGELSGDDFAFISNSDILLEKLKMNNEEYVIKKSLALDLSIFKKDKIMNLTEAKIKIQELNFLATGTIDSRSEKDVINMQIKGNKLDVKSFLSLLPSQFKSSINNYSSTGSFYTNVNLTGLATDPNIKANFGISNGTISESVYHTNISNIILDGSYNNGTSRSLKTSVLKLNSCSGKLANTTFKLNGYLHNFTNPFIDFNINAAIDLKEIKQFFNLDTLQILEGNIETELQLACPLSVIKSGKIPNDTEGKINGKFNVKNASFQFVNDTKLYHEINAELYADNNYINLNNLSFKNGNSELKLNGTLKNHLAIFNETNVQPVLIANVSIDNFDVKNWIPTTKTGVEKKSDSKLYFAAINMQLKASINEFKFNNFVASNLKSNIYFQNNQFRFDSLKFNTMDGKIMGTGILDFSDKNGYKFICNAKLSQISITKLFTELNNFGQTTLVDKNISGKLNATIQFKSSWDRNNAIKPESIVADADIEINEGTLKDFEPMNNLSKFIELSELKNIRFSQLANKINIINKKIYIPEFQINSSALNLSFSGIHNFDNIIDYHFKIILSELLSKKRKKNASQPNEFNEVEDDIQGKTTLFISMTGNISNPTIKLDKKGLKKYVKEEITSEKQTIRNLFKKDLGLLKGEKQVPETNKKNTTQNIQIEWDEQPDLKPVNNNNSNKNLKPNEVIKKSESTPKPTKKKEENADDFL